MITPTGQEKFSRRSLLLYLLLIALPACLFLYLSFHSVKRQWSQLVFSVAADLPSAGRALAARAEDRVVRETEQLLGDSRMRDLQAVSGVAVKNSDAARQLQSLAGEISRAYPLARHVFVVRNGAVVLPPMRAIPPVPPASVIKAEAGNARFSVALQAADRLERSNPTQAIVRLREAFEAAATPEAKAIMLVRIARAYRAMRLPTQAEESLRRAGELFPDLRDPHHVPYGLVALFAMHDINPAREETRAALRRAHLELLDGRWDMPVAQFNSLDRELRRRLGNDAAAFTGQTFADRMLMANALETALRNEHPRRVLPAASAERAPRTGDVMALAFRGRDNNYQAFYTVGEKGVLTGFVANLDWIDTELLPQLGSGTTFGIGPHNDHAPANTRVQFARFFPYWDIVIAPASVRKTAAQMDLFVLIGSAVLMLLITVGVTMLVRAIRSEREAAKMRIEFVNGVSHELKTPITLVKLYAETLLNDPELRSDQRECCDVILQESERLTNLVEHILDYTRVDRGVRKYNLVAGDLTPIVEGLVATCTRYLEQRGFTLAARVERDLPPVLFDPEAIPSLVLNLVDNAVKYSGNARLVRAGLFREGATVVLEVQDYGIGIKKSDIDRIFKPYFRVNVNYSRGGCGLGLALIKSIMEAHGGRIEVQSRVNEGSRFRLVFPVAGAGQPLTHSATA